MLRISLAVIAVAAAMAAATACAGSASSPPCVRGGTAVERAQFQRLIALYNAREVTCLRLVFETGNRLATKARGAVVAVTVSASDEDHLTLPLWKQGLVAGAFSDLHPGDRPLGLNITTEIAGRTREWGFARLGGSRVPVVPRESRAHLRSAIRTAAANNDLRIVSMSLGAGVLPTVTLSVAPKVSRVAIAKRLAGLELVFGASAAASRVDGFFIEQRDTQGKPRARIGYVARLGTAYSWRAP